MNTKNATKALVHFYFATELLKDLSEKELSIGDVIGVGEDVFLLDLYPYSNLIHKVMADFDIDVCDIRTHELYVYDSLADCFWGIVERDSQANEFAVMPDKDEFELDVNRLIDSL
jgi:hypothetical protein